MGQTPEAVTVGLVSIVWGSNNSIRSQQIPQVGSDSWRVKGNGNTKIDVGSLASCITKSETYRRCFRTVEIKLDIYRPQWS